MSFICALTGAHIVGKPTRIITGYRQKRYPVRYATRTIDGVPQRVCIDQGGDGREITGEALVSGTLPPLVRARMVEAKYGKMEGQSHVTT